MQRRSVRNAAGYQSCGHSDCRSVLCSAGCRTCAKSTGRHSACQELQKGCYILCQGTVQHTVLQGRCMVLLGCFHAVQCNVGLRCSGRCCSWHGYVEGCVGVPSMAQACSGKFAQVPYYCSSHAGQCRPFAVPCSANVLSTIRTLVAQC